MDWWLDEVTLEFLSALMVLWFYGVGLQFGLVSLDLLLYQSLSRGALFLLVFVQESEEDEPDAVEDETGSEETSSELRDDQTDTSSAEVPSARPRRAVTLRSSTESDRPPPMERARRSRRPQPISCSEVEKSPQVKEVSMTPGYQCFPYTALQCLASLIWGGYPYCAAAWFSTPRGFL